MLSHSLCRVSRHVAYRDAQVFCRCDVHIVVTGGGYTDKFQVGAVLHNLSGDLAFADRKPRSQSPMWAAISSGEVRSKLVKEPIASIGAQDKSPGLIEYASKIVNFIVLNTPCTYYNYI